MFPCSFVCNKVPSSAGSGRQLATDKRKSRHLTFSALPELSSCLPSHFSKLSDTFWKREIRVIGSLDVDRLSFLEERNALWVARQTTYRCELASRGETSRTTLRVGQPRRAGRTAAQPPPAPRGVGAREGALPGRSAWCTVPVWPLAAVRDGGDQNYLPPRRPGDAVSGEAVRAGGQSHSGGLQECPQEAKLQVLLQIYGRWLRVTAAGAFPGVEAGGGVLCWTWGHHGTRGASQPAESR